MVKHAATVIVAVRLLQPMQTAPPAAAVDPCLVPQRAKAVLAGARQPGGVELLPEALECHRLAARTREVAESLNGLPIASALDALVAVDPRYEWRNDRGA